MENINQIAADAFRAAYATKGKHAGMLLARAPKSNTLAYAAWQAAQMVANPYKVSIFGCIMFNEQQKAVYDRVLAVCEANPSLTRWLDRDRVSLTRMGVW